MDQIDHIILNILKDNSRASASDISREVKLSIPATAERIRKLEQTGIIEKYTVRVNPYQLGYNLTAFIQVKLNLSGELENFQQTVTSLPCVLECHHITGPADYLLKVVISDMQELEQFLSHSLKDIPGVMGTDTMLCLSTLKEEINP